MKKAANYNVLRGLFHLFDVFASNSQFVRRPGLVLCQVARRKPKVRVYEELLEQKLIDKAIDGTASGDLEFF